MFRRRSKFWAADAALAGRSCFRDEPNPSDACPGAGIEDPLDDFERRLNIGFQVDDAFRRRVAAEMRDDPFGDFIFRSDPASVDEEGSVEHCRDGDLVVSQTVSWQVRPVCRHLRDPDVFGSTDQGNLAGRGEDQHEHDPGHGSDIDGGEARLRRSDHRTQHGDRPLRRDAHRTRDLGVAIRDSGTRLALGSRFAISFHPA